LAGPWLKTILVGHGSDHDEVIERLNVKPRPPEAWTIRTSYYLRCWPRWRSCLSQHAIREGSTLAELLASRKLPSFSTLLGYADQICSALAFRARARRDPPRPEAFQPDAHAAGQIKVLDFGIAKQGDVSLPQSGMVVGTPSTWPRTGDGQGNDHRLTSFALGAVFYELFTGKKAFPADTVTRCFNEVVTSGPKSARGCQIRSCRLAIDAA